MFELMEREGRENHIGTVAIERVGKRGERRRAGDMRGRGRGVGGWWQPPTPRGALCICMVMPHDPKILACRGAGGVRSLF